ncbi:MAG: hypothetical protein IJH83_00550 [Coriobacteriales bacterium]|nr:hypothetical protein [Coriobacteriales bacterium]
MDDSMEYLFCTDVDDAERTPVEERFVSKMVPDFLLRSYDEAEDEYDEAAGAYDMPYSLKLIRSICFWLGLILAIAILKPGDVSFAEGYHNAAWLYWFTAGLLLVAAALRIFERRMQRRMREDAGVKAAEERTGASSLAIHEFTGSNGESFDIDVLSFLYSGDERRLQIKGEANIPVMRLFQRDGDVCLYKRDRVYSFKKEELARIRMIHHGIPMTSWNKADSPSQKEYTKSGVMIFRGDIISGLRFCCALDIVRDGETASLLFPAYELPVVERVTGLLASELPSVAYDSSVEIERRVPEQQVDAAPPADVVADDERVRPLFYWSLPPKELRSAWFSPASDVEFRVAHPTEYGILMFLMIAFFLVPPVLYGRFAWQIPGAENNAWSFFGFIGAFVFGTGFCNIVAAWMRQYFGHFVTIACFVVGIAMMTIGWVHL